MGFGRDWSCSRYWGDSGRVTVQAADGPTGNFPHFSGSSLSGVPRSPEKPAGESDWLDSQKVGEIVKIVDRAPIPPCGVGSAAHRRVRVDGKEPPQSRGDASVPL